MRGRRDRTRNERAKSRPQKKKKNTTLLVRFSRIYDSVFWPQNWDFREGKRKFVPLFRDRGFAVVVSVILSQKRLIWLKIERYVKN